MSFFQYTLAEAAEALNLSETVLQQLAHMFQVPSVTHGAPLTFTDNDISFYLRVREQLLAGETLSEIKASLIPSAVSYAEVVHPDAETFKPSLQDRFKNLSPPTQSDAWRVVSGGVEDLHPPATKTFVETPQQMPDWETDADYYVAPKKPASWSGVLNKLKPQATTTSSASTDGDHWNWKTLLGETTQKRVAATPLVHQLARYLREQSEKATPSTPQRNAK